MCQWFAPTELRVTFETQGLGKFSKEEIERIVVKNVNGTVTLNLPTKFVLTANHQVSSSIALILEMLLIGHEGLRRLVVCLVSALFHRT